MDYVAIAVAPGLAICLYIFYKDIYNREPRLNLFVSFILGCAAILPAIGFENAFPGLNQSVLQTHAGTVSETAVFAYCVVGFSEEFSKFLGLRLYSYNQKSFDEPLDGIVYSVMVSMGFATVENVMYVVQAQDMNLALIRMFLSVPAHATFAIIMGYYIGKAKFDSKNSFGLMLTGLLGAIFFHGTFDFFIFLNTNQMVAEQVGNGLLFFGAIASFVISLVMCRKLIRHHRDISKKMFKDKNTNTSA